MGGVEAGELVVRGDAATVGRPQGIAVDVRDEPEVFGAADGTVAAGGLTHMATGPEELGVGIADVVAISPAGPHVAEHGSPSEHVVDVAHWRRV